METLITKGQTGAIVTVLRENQHGFERWSIVPHKTLQGHPLTSMYTHWKTKTNSIVAKPRDISFISSIKKDRATFHPPSIVNQVTVTKRTVVLVVEMVHLAEQMDSIIKLHDVLLLHVTSTCCWNVFVS